MVLLEIKR